MNNDGQTAGMERPDHTVVSLTSKWPTGLKCAASAAAELGVPEARLVQLANDGYAPHYRIDGGTPLFRSTELRDWAAGNLLSKEAGRSLKNYELRIVGAMERCDLSRLPLALREASGLCEISNEVLRSGIYFLCRGDDVVYVGQSTNVYARVACHVGRKDWTRAFFLPLPSDELDRFEGALIRALRPIGNSSAPGGWSACSSRDELTLNEFKALAR